MSLEESFADLAKSNNTLAAANNKLADAMIQYGGVMKALAESDPGKVISIAAAIGETKADDKPKGKPGPKAKAKEEPAAKEDDGLGGDDDGLGAEEEAAKEYTLDDVKAALVALKKKDEGALKKVWTKFGVSSLGQIDKGKYGDVMKYVGSL
jgi:hypothetical protein